MVVVVAAVVVAATKVAVAVAKTTDSETGRATRNTLHLKLVLDGSRILTKHP